MANKREKTGIFVNCEWCGKETYQTLTQYNKGKHHFCSHDCQMKYQHEQTYEDRVCEICGDIFHVSKKSKQRFCSIKCQGKWQSTQTGKNNPRYNRIECACDKCGKIIYLLPSNYNRFKYHFCSDECRKEWNENIYSKTDACREMHRKIAVEILKNSHAITQTKPQVIINNLLDELNIEYENEGNFTYYSVDNYLFNNDLIIEVMGDFWHSNPLKYDTYDKLGDIQRRRISKDKAKHSYILNQYGIEILYLWENDIYNNLELCKNLILKYIEKNGVLDNYHSFNYYLDNEELKLRNELIYTYQEIA